MIPSHCLNSWQIGSDFTLVETASLFIWYILASRSVRIAFLAFIITQFLQFCHNSPKRYRLFNEFLKILKNNFHTLQDIDFVLSLRTKVSYLTSTAPSNFSIESHRSLFISDFSTKASKLEENLFAESNFWNQRYIGQMEAFVFTISRSKSGVRILRKQGAYGLWIQMPQIKRSKFRFILKWWYIKYLSGNLIFSWALAYIF